MKCGHSIELATVFNQPEITFDTGRAFDETFSKTMRKMWVQFAKTGNPSLSAGISPDGKAKEWPLYDLKDRKVMVFDEFNIHPEKEADKKIVDWDRTYFLLKIICFCRFRQANELSEAWKAVRIKNILRIIFH